MNTKATPELIAADDFDAVIAACGSLPKRPPVNGGDNPQIWTPIDCFGNEEKLGQRVIVVGGASTGCETALYLADHGHNVTLLTRHKRICHDDVSHGGEFFSDMILNHPNITAICEIATQAADGESVTAQKRDGTEVVLPADSVVFSAGVAPQFEECAKFAGLTPEFYIIGDSNIHTDELWRTFEFSPIAKQVSGNVLHCTRTACAAAMSL